MDRVKKESPETGATAAGNQQSNTQDKDKASNPEKQTISPVFQPLHDPETFKDINPFKKEAKNLPASESQIIEKLLETIEPVDFELQAYPQLFQLRKELSELETKDSSTENPDSEINNKYEKIEQIRFKVNKLKVKEKHLIILAVENVIKHAELHNWAICRHDGFTYLYNGVYWSRIAKDTLQNFLGQAAEKMGISMFSSRYFAFRDKLLMQFYAVSLLKSPDPPEFSVLVNLLNGTYEITPTGSRLRPFNSKDFLNYQLNFKYDPIATAPLFMEYLNKVLPDQELQNILSEFLGYIFVKTRYLKLEVALFLYGPGANGKSVIYDIIYAMLGNTNVTSYSLEKLTDKTGYARAMIAGKLVNYASEINGKLEVSFFKQLASGEPIEARLPFGEPMIISDYAKLIFNLNELPREVEHTHAFFRRLQIIPFNVTIPESEQDKQLAIKIIESELSGVFNWVLQGLGRLLKNKAFTKCYAVSEAVEKFKLESDSVRLFIDDNGYKPCPNSSVLLKDLYREYRQYCSDDGNYPVNKQNFKKRLEGQGIFTERRNDGNNVLIQKLSINPF